MYPVMFLLFCCALTYCLCQRFDWFPLFMHAKNDNTYHILTNISPHHKHRPFTILSIFSYCTFRSSLFVKSYNQAFNISIYGDISSPQCSGPLSRSRPLSNRQNRTLLAYSNDFFSSLLSFLLQGPFIHNNLAYSLFLHPFLPLTTNSLSIKPPRSPRSREGHALCCPDKPVRSHSPAISAHSLPSSLLHLA